MAGAPPEALRRSYINMAATIAGRDVAVWRFSDLAPPLVRNALQTGI